MLSKRSGAIYGIILIIGLSFLASGCAVNFYKQSPRNRKKIKDLQSKITDLERQRLEEQTKFDAVKRMLEKKLRSSSDERISLSLNEQGLVIILSDDILFASGKAKLKSGADSVLNKVSSIIRREVPNKNISVSGHTDNVPIKHSAWKSNWELSTARSTNVLHYLEDSGMDPKKLSATGYGEHHPVESNSTSKGRAKNRRVEIVILPEFSEERDSFSK